MNGTTATFSPVTESEMRDFFNRLISTIVHHSQTDKELQELKQRFEDLNSRVTSLVAENEALRRDMYSVTVEKDRAMQQVKDTEALANSYAHDLSRVREELAQVSRHLHETVEQREQARAEASAAKDKLSTLQNFFRKMFDAEELKATVTPEVPQPTPQAEVVPLEGTSGQPWWNKS